jgi:hypothetical protein
MNTVLKTNLDLQCQAQGATPTFMKIHIHTCKHMHTFKHTHIYISTVKFTESRNDSKTIQSCS